MDVTRAPIAKSEQNEIIIKHYKCCLFLHPTLEQQRCH